MKALVAHPGTQYAPWLARELALRGALFRFATGLSFSEDGLVAFLLGSKGRRLSRLSNRFVSRAVSPNLATFPITELWALFELWRGKNSESVLHKRNRKFQRLIPNEWIAESTHVIGFDTSSWILAKRARSLDRPFILDRSIGHPLSKEAIYRDLRRKFPDWSDTIPTKAGILLENEESEHKTSSHIVVPSSFVRDTLIHAGITSDKISIVPFGTNLEVFSPASEPPSGPITFLYAGGITARKGLPILLQAWEEAHLGADAQLLLAGWGPDSILRRMQQACRGVRVLGQLSRSQLASVMRRTHVFVFPSFFEGLAQVQVEALAAGVPVIGTTASGAADIVTEGETGFVLEPGNVGALAACLRKVCYDSDLLSRLRRQCIATRKERGWDLYGERWMGILKNVPSTTAATSARRVSLKVIVAQPGTQHGARIAEQLSRKNHLLRYYTGFAFRSGTRLDWLSEISPKVIRQAFSNRRLDGLSADALRTYPQQEIAGWFRLRAGADPQGVMHKRNAAFQNAITQEDLAQARAVIAFDTSGWILAERCAKMGIPLILDQTIGHPRSKQRVYELIHRQFPDWSDDLELRDRDVSDAEDTEHDKAKCIVVASTFTKTTLVENGVAPEKIVLNPYGVDLLRFSTQQQPRKDRPFRFLFAGLISARKGIPLLLQAWKTLRPKHADLWIVGPVSPTAPRDWLGDTSAKFLGKVSNAELAAVMAESDVFVFPSYFEGFALVLLEAMASGLPVITTTATAGPDIISHNQDGWLVQPGDLDGLVRTMSFCLENRDRVAEMGASSRRTAEHFSWDAYGDRWHDVLKKLRL
jgi:starch synthase